MRDPSETLKNDVLSEYLDDERVLALTLAIWYLNGVHSNPNATPSKIGTLFETSDKITRYLQGTS